VYLASVVTSDVMKVALSYNTLDKLLKCNIEMSTSVESMRTSVHFRPSGFLFFPVSAFLLPHTSFTLSTDS